jgi:hypothetical protein
MQHNDEKFSGGDRVVDGNQYSGCSFDGCKIIYRGGGVPSLANCHFNNCTWHFEDAAQRTLFFLRLIYNGMGEGGQNLVDSAVAQIREPMRPAS